MWGKMCARGLKINDVALFRHPHRGWNPIGKIYFYLLLLLFQAINSEHLGFPRARGISRKCSRFLVLNKQLVVSWALPVLTVNLDRHPLTRRLFQFHASTPTTPSTLHRSQQQKCEMWRRKTVLIEIIETEFHPSSFTWPYVYLCVWPCNTTQLACCGRFILIKAPDKCNTFLE